MKLAIKISVVFLLFGVLANQLVVFRIAFVQQDVRIPFGSGVVWLDPVSDRSWWIDRSDSLGLTSLRVMSYGATQVLSSTGAPSSPEPPPELPLWSVVADRPFLHSHSGGLHIDEFAMGWPMRSQHYYRAFLSASNLGLAHQVHGAWVYPGSRVDDVFLTHPMPLIPIWPGFIVNPLFYAIVAWMLWFLPVRAPRKLKGWLRRRKHCCEACGYPIGQSPVCTECGGDLATIVP